MALAGTVLLVKDHTLFRVCPTPLHKQKWVVKKMSFSMFIQTCYGKHNLLGSDCMKRDLKVWYTAALQFLLLVLLTAISPLDLSPLDLLSKYFCPGSMNFHPAKLKPFSWGHKLFRVVLCTKSYSDSPQTTIHNINNVYCISWRYHQLHSGCQKMKVGLCLPPKKFLIILRRLHRDAGSRNNLGPASWLGHGITFLQRGSEPATRPTQGSMTGLENKEGWLKGSGQRRWLPEKLPVGVGVMKRHHRARRQKTVWNVKFAHAVCRNQMQAQRMGLE